MSASIRGHIAVPATAYRITAHLLGDRIETKGLSLESWRTIMPTPRIVEREDGIRIAILRFGAIVIAEPTSVSNTPIPDAIRANVAGAFDPIEIEAANIVLGDPNGDSLGHSNDAFIIADFSVERFSVLADALGKSVALARDERKIGAVFEQLEPFARDLANTGGRWLKAGESLKLLGGALLTQHRMVGRVEADEKPEILWERPDLLRLYNRLDEEYELSERGRALSRKLKVIEETSRAISEVADAYTSRRLELAIIALIAFEIVLSLTTMALGIH